MQDLGSRRAPKFFSEAEAFISLIKFLLKAFKFRISDSDLGLLWKRALKATIFYPVAYQKIAPDLFVRGVAHELPRASIM